MAAFEQKPRIDRYRKERTGETATLQPVGDRVLEAFGLIDGVTVARINDARVELFGQLSEFIEATELKNGRLTIAVQGDARRHAFSLRAREFLRKLADFTNGRVKKVYLI